MNGNTGGGKKKNEKENGKDNFEKSNFHMSNKNQTNERVCYNVIKNVTYDSVCFSFHFQFNLCLKFVSEAFETCYNIKTCGKDAHRAPIT